MKRFVKSSNQNELLTKETLYVSYSVSFVCFVISFCFVLLSVVFT